MSRIGEKIINIPDGVTVDVKDRTISVNGPLGKDSILLIDGLELKIESGIISVVKKGDDNDRKLRAFHGLSRSLIANMITGVSTGFKKELEIIGVGYRALQQNQDVEFHLGFSHSITYTPPEGISVKVLEPTKLEVSGIDKQKVGQVAANIRGYRPPEPYKGKGVRYKDEYVRKKAGKAGKV